MSGAAEKRRRLWLSSAAGTALTAAIVGLANVASQYAYGRLDFSRGRIYSISGATRRILRALPDPVLVRVYYSKELPPQIAISLHYLRDLLKEYSSGSRRKVRTRFVEVGDSPKVRDEALQSGIAPVRFDIFSKERYEQREGFLGLVLQYQDKKEVIPYLQEVNGLEYELTSRVKLLSAPRKPVLGFATLEQSMGHEGLDQNLAERLGARFELRDVDLTTVSVDSGIPADVGALFLLGPQGRVPDKALFLLDQYLLSGRALCVAVDTKKADMRSFVASELDTGLLPFLKHHGFDVEPTLVMDAQSQPIQVSMRQGPFMFTNIVQYPPIVLATNLGKSHAVTARLDSLVLPFASPVRPAAGGAEVLVRSSPYSWAKRPAEARFLSLNPFQFPPKAASDEKGPFPLAAARMGVFEPMWDRPPSGVKAKNYLSKAAGPGRMAVVGTSKMFAADFKSQDGDSVFFMNLADWLSQDTDLIAVRSKTTTFHALSEIPPPLKQAIRWADIFIPPVTAIAGGLLMWRRRSRRRALARAAYAPVPAPAAPPVPARTQA